MRKYAVLLTLVAIVIAGCERSAEVASTNVATESSTAAPVKATSQFYTVAEYDPARNADADLLETIEQAKNSNKRIILEIGGHW